VSNSGVESLGSASLCSKGRKAAEGKICFEVRFQKTATCSESGCGLNNPQG
jgi:hypothetical protein